MAIDSGMLIDHVGDSRAWRRGTFGKRVARDDTWVKSEDARRMGNEGAKPLDPPHETVRFCWRKVAKSHWRYGRKKMPTAASFPLLQLHLMAISSQRAPTVQRCRKGSRETGEAVRMRVSMLKAAMEEEVTGHIQSGLEQISLVGPVPWRAVALWAPVRD